MNRLIRISVMCLLVAARLYAAAEEPAWVHQLEQCSIVDSVVNALDTTAADSGLTVYHLYYHQPLCHRDTAKGRFQLRCVMVVRNDNDPATCSNELYFRGYDINAQWKTPVKYLYRKNYSEIAQRYHSNLIMPEHRYFSQSAPDSAWQKLDCLNAQEAAEDFHALISALKTVFRGKWVITGISKGGITAAMQHAFHPEDGDVFVPNCGPFCRTASDLRLHQYFENNGWTPAMRGRLDSLYRATLEDTTAIRIFGTLYRETRPRATDYECRKAYLVNTLENGFSLHSYTARNKVDSVIDSWQGLPEDTLAARLLALSAKTVVDDPTGSTAYTMTREQWESDGSMPYYYQACLELGQYSYDFHYIYTEPEKQALADSLQAFFTQEEPDYTTFQKPWLKAVTYDDYRLFSMVEQKTQQATKPILFLYSGDDPWTGAAMPDAFINGTNVRKYVLEGQPHGTSIDMDTTALKTEIWDFLDSVMLAPSVIPQVRKEENAPRKIFYRNRLIIHKNGRNYNAAGQLEK